MEAQITEKVSGISVVIPCYRSKGTLPLLVERLDAVLSRLADDYEVILVSDRSPDNTWEIIQQLAQKNPKIRGCELARNCGQQVAVMAGLGMVRKDFVVTMDDDLQQAPEDIAPMLKKLLDEDLDIIIAKLKGKKHGFVRNMGTRLVRMLAQSILQLKKPIKFSSYRVFRKWVSDAAIDLNMPQPVVGYALLTVTDRVANYKISHAERQDRERSGYNFRQLVSYFNVMLFSYSVVPMRIISLIGFLGAFLSLGMAVTYFTLALMGVIGGNGFATIIVALSAFFGVLMAAIGVLGRYVVFLIKVAAGNKLYYVRSSTDKQDPINKTQLSSQSKANDIKGDKVNGTVGHPQI